MTRQQLEFAVLHELSDLDLSSTTALHMRIYQLPAMDCPPPPSKPSPITAKMMIVGDSISHGLSGDWTWRWRLAEWLQSNGNNIKFAGPYLGTHGGPDPAAQTPPEEAQDLVGPYHDGVSAEFAAMGHASYWGRAAIQTKDTVYSWVSTYQPDYILVLLGFNDLGWLFTPPSGLISTMHDIIKNARKGNPNIKILFGNVVQRLFIPGRQDLVDSTIEYNRLLKIAVKEWDRKESRVVGVDVAERYRCGPEGCSDGYDGLHPNEHGEWSIAKTFADVLRGDFGFPGDGLKVPKREVALPRQSNCCGNTEKSTSDAGIGRQ